MIINAPPYPLYRMWVGVAAVFVGSFVYGQQAVATHHGRASPTKPTKPTKPQLPPKPTKPTKPRPALAAAAARLTALAVREGDGRAGGGSSKRTGIRTIRY